MMTTEEKAKAYDDAFKKAEDIRRFSSDPAEIKRMEDIFPALKESEDEKIRKWIIENIQETLDVNGFFETQKTMAKNAIAWLEKQGEHYNFRKKIQVGDHVTRNEDGVLVNLSQLKRVAKPADVVESENQGEQKSFNNDIIETIKKKIIDHFDNHLMLDSCCSIGGLKNDILKIINESKQNEQKPAWSEEDEKFVHGLIRGLAAKRDIHSHTTFSSDCIDITKTIDWLNSLKDRILPQPKQEWSEEDETVLNNLIYALANDRIGNNRDEYVNWLKSLRPQPKQEWSKIDEAYRDYIIMNCMNYAEKNGYVDEKNNYQIHQNAKDWLKSLRPQSHWRPSEEQLKVLRKIRIGGVPDVKGNDLVLFDELYDSLLRL